MRIEFFADDDREVEILSALAGFPAFSVERSEMEAFLYTTLARASWRDADRHRDLARRQATREARRAQ